MHNIRRSLGLAVVSALVGTGFTLSASASETSPVARASHGRPQMAAGIIVKTTSANPSTSLLRDAESKLAGNVSVAKVRSKGGREAVLVTSKRIPAAQAEALATQLRKRSDVVSASPNYISYAFGTAPVVTNDTYFSSLKQIWDPRTKSDSRVKAVMGSTNTFPTGGYSSKAPSLWRKTTGTEQVVAVVDTGITDHPDLANQILPGYDFVSQFPLTDEEGNVVEYEDSGRDGDGRDSDPHDRGDWEPANYCALDGPAYPSTWHGTHVSGIVAAEGNNGQGVVGVARGVKILPVRVLGLCGGTIEDIADGIRWAAGLPVTGAPDNPNPADVINLSLGGDFPCTVTDAPEYVSAIHDARAAGAVVVAAAGNDGVNIGSEPVSPATCPGVISVGSTSEYGDRAGYKVGTRKVIYSNYGTSLDISAPGGDTFWDNRSILSTLNTGTKSPTTPAYGEYDGTSMAAPVVSAGAALLRSLGTFTPSQTEAALKVAVAPFPSGTNSQFKKCTTSICGKGILDLSKVPAPRYTVKISGSPVVGEPLTAVPGTWLATPASFTYTWLRDGTPIAGATNSSYTVGQADVGSKLRVRIAPSTSVFSPIISTSVETAAVPQGPTVTLSNVPVSTKYGVGANVTVTVASGVDPVDGPVELRRGSTVLASGVTSGGSVELQVPGKAWLAGSDDIRAAFLGTESQPASSSSTQTVTVAKASASNSIVLPTTISPTTQAKLTVTVTVAGDSQPTGVLEVYDGTTKIMGSSLILTDNGKKVLTLPKLKAGTHQIKVVYAGNANINAKTSAVKTITSK
ncbi:MAG: S8 family serine peptidase [Aeromicrobium sp.]